MICKRCHRVLKNPVSIRNNMGPVCFAKDQQQNRHDRYGRPRANYTIVDQNAERILIKDIGPWDQYMTITNAAETVVEEMVAGLLGRRLYYIDSEGEMDELLVTARGTFGGFKILPRM